MSPLFSSLTMRSLNNGRLLLLTLLFVSLRFVIAPNATAQEVAKNSPEAERAETAAETKAFEMLDSMAEHIMMLHAPENRIYMETAIADMMWSKDEKRARALYDAVTKDVTTMIGNVDLTDQQSFNTLSAISGIRQEIVSRMGARDPEMALAFLRATRMPSADEGKRTSREEQNLELQLAAQIASVDYQRALKIGRARLSSGFNYQMLNILTTTYSKDPEAARLFHKDIVEYLRDENVLRQSETLSAAWSLLGSFQPPQATEETYGQLIEILVSTALASGSGNPSNSQNLYHQAQSYLPQIMKYAPARAAAMEQWLQRVERTFDPSARMYIELGRINQNNGTVEDLLALAQKYPAELQPQIYHQAAWKALSSGNAERARQIITEHISEPLQRAEMLSHIDNQTIWNNVGQSKTTETRRLLRKVRDVYRRTQILNQLATNLLSAGDKKGAMDALNEAKSLVTAAPVSSSTLQAQMELARAFASLDVDQSVALMQGVVLQMNQLISAGAVLDGVENHYLQEGEWLRRGSSGLNNLVNSMDQQLGMIATQPLNGERPPTESSAVESTTSTKGFDTACALAEQLERPEVRLMAQLEIVQAVLASRMRMPPNGYGRIVSFYRVK